MFKKKQSKPQNLILSKDTNCFELNVAGFIFPLLGFVLYLIFDKKYPLAANGCKKWSALGFMAYISAAFLFFIIYIITTKWVAMGIQIYK